MSEEQILEKPIINCHMLMSLDGKVTGSFLSKPECKLYIEKYREVGRKFPCNSFICGSSTMKEFAGENTIDLSTFKETKINKTEDYIQNLSEEKYYAIAFDSKGKINWKENKLNYSGNPIIIEVVSEKASDEYLSYLQNIKMNFIICGKEEINTKLALHKLKTLFKLDFIRLAGGPTINTSFLKENLIDELTLITAPFTADTNDKPLFISENIEKFKLINYEIMPEGGLISYYKKDNNNNKPYILCHMLISLDGKTTGNYLALKESENACNEYWKIHEKENPDITIVGKKTIVEDFLKGGNIDLSNFKDKKMNREDFINKKDYKKFVCIYDRKGNIPYIKDTMYNDIYPDYNGYHIIAVLCENVNDDYLCYLQSIGVSYIFVGKNEIFDYKLSLEKLYKLFDARKILLEGGSTINAPFEKEKLIDEISLMQLPYVAQNDGKPLFLESIVSDFKLCKVEKMDEGTLLLRYKQI